jgi:hypothetical protein
VRHEGRAIEREMNNLSLQEQAEYAARDQQIQSNFRVMEILLYIQIALVIAFVLLVAFRLLYRPWRTIKK